MDIAWPIMTSIAKVVALSSIEAMMKLAMTYRPRFPIRFEEMPKRKMNSPAQHQTVIVTRMVSSAEKP